MDERARTRGISSCSERPSERPSRVFEAWRPSRLHSLFFTTGPRRARRPCLRTIASQLAKVIAMTATCTMGSCTHGGRVTPQTSLTRFDVNVPIAVVNEVKVLILLRFIPYRVTLGPIDSALKTRGTQWTNRSPIIVESLWRPEKEAGNSDDSDRPWNLKIVPTNRVVAELGKQWDFKQPRSAKISLSAFSKGENARRKSHCSVCG